MQSITKVVETRDFPYNDEYLWKNNGKSKKRYVLITVHSAGLSRRLIDPFPIKGNTVHKGSGEKSIYYKCSNSSKVSSAHRGNDRRLGFQATQTGELTLPIFRAVR
jgi:hypothetical protein